MSLSTTKVTKAVGAAQQAAVTYLQSLENISDEDAGNRVAKRVGKAPVATKKRARLTKP